MKVKILIEKLFEFYKVYLKLLFSIKLGTSAEVNKKVLMSAQMFVYFSNSLATLYLFNVSCLQHFQIMASES